MLSGSLDGTSSDPSTVTEVGRWRPGGRARGPEPRGEGRPGHSPWWGPGAVGTALPESWPRHGTGDSRRRRSPQAAALGQVTSGQWAAADLRRWGGGRALVPRRRRPCLKGLPTENAFWRYSGGGFHGKQLLQEQMFFISLCSTVFFTLCP